VGARDAARDAASVGVVAAPEGPSCRRVDLAAGLSAGGEHSRLRVPLPDRVDTVIMGA